MANKNNDLLATKNLLQIIKQEYFQAKLNDKKYRKKSLWTEISDKMAELGFVMQDRGAERCFQKFRNLEYRYKEYIQNIAMGSKLRRSPPEFLEELEIIFGDKYTIQSLSNKASMSEDTISNTGVKRVRSGSGKGCAKRLKLQDPLGLINHIRQEQSQRDQDYFALHEHLHKAQEQREEKRFRDMKSLLEKQHRERMTVTYALIKALKNEEPEIDEKH